MTRRFLREEEGQVFPALLLVVVVLVGLGLMLGQLGSAADQRSQTQTAADAAGVAAAAEVRRAAVLESLTSLPGPLGNALGALGGIGGGLGGPAQPAAAGCSAAQRNWDANPHDSSLTCADVTVRTDRPRVRASILAPEGEIVDGPIEDAERERVRARSTVRIRFDECPQGQALDDPASAAQAVVAARIVDRTAERLDLEDPRCAPGLGLGMGLGWGNLLGPILSGLGEAGSSDELDDLVSGVDPLRLAERSFRIEIVD